MNNPEVWFKDVAGSCEQNRNECYVGNFLDICATIKLSRRTLLRGVS